MFSGFPTKRNKRGFVSEPNAKSSEQYPSGEHRHGFTGRLPGFNQLRKEFLTVARRVATTKKQAIGEAVERASGGAFKYGDVGRMTEADTPKLRAANELMASALAAPWETPLNEQTLFPQFSLAIRDKRYFGQAIFLVSKVSTRTGGRTAAFGTLLPVGFAGTRSAAWTAGAPRSTGHPSARAKNHIRDLHPIIQRGH